ncbi:hypothetical protein HU200_021864 [Digitaria exilis]|uniref:Major facilitator superfamily (MFS) profile domain-containing protein n=1 Tax=Digitaria exilis TaxID=1010633 RepID=A0A835EYZ5_9POAL|nr:hypothetical protein HU200_021864 [Digitaria exilis]
MGFGKFQALVLVYAGTGWLADSMELMLLSFVGPLVRQQWNVSAQHESLLSSVVFTGMLIGACSWGYISDKYGRRTALLFSIILTTGAGFLSALSPNYISLLIVLSRLSWRWLLAFTAIPCFVLLLLFVIAPESPRYLCVQNRLSDATLVLERMAKANKVALPPGVLAYHKEAQSVDHNPASQNGHLPVRENDCTLDNVMSSKSGGIAALRRLFSPKFLRSTLLIWFVWFANSFAYYGLVLLSSQLSDANRRCTSGQKSGVQQKNVNLYKDVFITSLAEFPGLVISAIIVDWFGRKATMWILLFGCCAFLGPLAVHQKESVTTALLFGARACGMGSSTVLCLYAPEVYPTSARSTGVGIATAIGKIGGIVCPIIAVGMLRSCHQMQAVVVFELVLGLAGVACILFPVETKGREMK